MIGIGINFTGWSGLNHVINYVEADIVDSIFSGENLFVRKFFMYSHNKHAPNHWKDSCRNGYYSLVIRLKFIVDATLLRFIIFDLEEDEEKKEPKNFIIWIYSQCTTLSQNAENSTL